MIHVLLDPKIYDKAPPAHYPPPFSITVTSESATSIVFHYTNNTGVRVDGSMDLVGGKWVVGLIPNITGAARATGNCTPTTTTATGVAGSEG